MQCVLFKIKIKMVFSHVQNDLLLAFSFSKSEFQLPKQSEEAGHERVI